MFALSFLLSFFPGLPSGLPFFAHTKILAVAILSSPLLSQSVEEAESEGESEREGVRERPIVRPPVPVQIMSGKAYYVVAERASG